MTDEQENGDDVVRSLNSRLISLVRFQNRTGRCVDLIWIDYQGQPRVQLELETDQDINYNTYVTHPWRAEDTESKSSLLLNFSEIFYPSHPEAERVDFRNGTATVRRREVDITTPVYSLEKYCKDAIKRFVTRENVNHLPLPAIIIKNVLDEY